MKNKIPKTNIKDHENPNETKPRTVQITNKNLRKIHIIQARRILRTNTTYSVSKIVNELIEKSRIRS
jgi:hypothetical protein